MTEIYRIRSREALTIMVSAGRVRRLRLAEGALRVFVSAAGEGGVGGLSAAQQRIAGSVAGFVRYFADGRGPLRSGRGAVVGGWCDSAIARWVCQRRGSECARA